MRLWLTILMLSMLCSTSYSQTSERARITKGKPAPFSGNLLTDRALAKIVSKLKGRIKLLKLGLEKLQLETKAKRETAAAVCKAELNGVAAKSKAVADGFVTERKLYTTALKKSNLPNPWYKSPYLHFMLGSVVGGGLCAAATAGSR